MSLSTQVKEGSQCWLVRQTLCQLIHTSCRTLLFQGAGVCVQTLPPDGWEMASVVCFFLDL